MVDLVAMENGFCPVKFSYEDFENAKYGGPWQPNFDPIFSWMIFNHYLTVRPWQPNFDPNQRSLESLLVWVIPCLPIEYFDYNFLMRLG